MLISKLNCIKIQTHGYSVQETKLQKYMREKNEKILEKCFNIKTEKPVTQQSEPLKEMQIITTKMLPGQLSSQESCQPNEDINSKITTNNEKTTTLDSSTEASSLPNSKTSKSNTMELSKSTNRFATSQNQKRPYTTAEYKRNATSNYSGSKSFRNIQSSARSSSATNWKSPFTSFTTTGIRTRLQRDQQSTEFAYDLSRDELKFSGQFRSPMKPAPEAERQLLKNGQRKEYLSQRYEHSPVVKYNYPEATSWRIGWLQQQQQLIKN